MQVRAVSRLYKTIPSATVVHRCLQVPLDNQYHFFVHFLQIVFLPRAATMAVFPCYVLLLLSVWAPSASTSPHHTKDSALTTTLESSGSGPPEPPGLMLHRGVVKVVRLDSNLPARGSGLFKRAPTAHRGGPRRPFPAFLSRGRAGPAGGQAGAPPPPPQGEGEPPGAGGQEEAGAADVAAGGQQGATQREGVSGAQPEGGPAADLQSHPLPPGNTRPPWRSLALILML